MTKIYNNIFVLINKPITNTISSLESLNNSRLVLVIVELTGIPSCPNRFTLHHGKSDGKLVD